MSSNCLLLPLMLVLHDSSAINKIFHTTADMPFPAESCLIRIDVVLRGVTCDQTDVDIGKLRNYIKPTEVHACVELMSKITKLSNTM